MSESLTKSTFQFVEYFAFENKYEENRDTQEDVVSIQNIFNIFRFIKWRNEFKQPWYAHHSEQFQIHDESVNEEMFH